jgi:DnaJ-class molecular chaperone
VDAVLGCEIEVTNIYEEKKKVKIPGGTQNE